MLVLFPPWTFAPHVIALLISAILIGIFLICTLIIWFLILSRLHIIVITVSLLLSLLLGTVLAWFLFGLAGWHLFWGMFLIVGLSMFTVFIGAESLMGDTLEMSAAESAGSRSEGVGIEAADTFSLSSLDTSAPAPTARFHQHPYRLYILSFLFGVAFMLSASFGGLSVFHSQLRWDMAICSLGILLGSIVFARHLTLGSLFIVATPLTIAGVLLALFPEVNFHLSESLFSFGFLIYLLFAVILFCNFSRVHETNVFRVACLLVFSVFSGCFTGRCIPLVLGDFLGMDALSVRLLVVVFVIVLLVVLTITSLMTEQRLFSIRFKSSEKSISELLRTSEIAPEALFEAFASRHNLGMREAEVFGLLLRGASASQVARSMTIANGTAKAHIRHIYEKLNVHNREELLQLYLREIQ
jgi:DNA-binding CsgD family transcriptional regulator